MVCPEVHSWRIIPSRSYALPAVCGTGKQLNLGSDKAATFKTYHGLMQQRAEVLPAVKPDATAPPLVVVIVDEFAGLVREEPSTRHLVQGTSHHFLQDDRRWYDTRSASSALCADVGGFAARTRARFASKPHYRRQTRNEVG